MIDVLTLVLFDPLASFLQKLVALTEDCCPGRAGRNAGGVLTLADPFVTQGALANIRNWFMWPVERSGCDTILI